MEQLRQFVALENERHRMEDEVERLKAAANQVEQCLLPQFRDEKIKRITIEGRTVFVDRKISTKACNGDRPAVCKALKASRMGSLVVEDYNTAALSGYVKRLIDDEKAIPKRLAKVIEIEDSLRLRSRRV